MRGGASQSLARFYSHKAKYGAPQLYATREEPRGCAFCSRLASHVVGWRDVLYPVCTEHLDQCCYRNRRL